jgi:hypothetical protein
VATTVFDVIKVRLDDGREIECKPLKIKYLREFMTTIKGLEDVVTDNVGSLDILINCCEIALKQYVKDGISREEMEDILDLPTMYRIVEGASGIVLDDASPNQ